MTATFTLLTTGHDSLDARNAHMQERQEGFCIVHGTVPTLKVLDSTTLEDIVQRMQTRGWTPDGPVESFGN